MDSWPIPVLFVRRVVNKGGLGQLYEILLESSSQQILTVMKVVLHATESGRPVLFFCKIGKDRTGLIAALILAACGASDIEIISDYARCGLRRQGLA